MLNSKLNDYLSDRTLEKILENFTRATGINLVIRDLKGEQITTLTNSSRLWAEIVKNDIIKEEVFKKLLDNMESSMRSGHIHIFNRYLDTNTFILPIYIEGRITAFFISGMTRVGNPNIGLCMGEAEKLKMELDDYLEMYLELPLVSMDKLEASANLLRVIATTITTLTKEENEIKAKISHISSLNDFLKQEVKNSSKELKLSEERYYILFNNMNDGAYITDINGILLDINPAGAKMLGYSCPQELIGTNFRDVYVDPKDRDEQVVKVILNKGYLQNYHPYVKVKKGASRFFETNAIGIRSETGDIVGIQGIFRDISHRPYVSESRKHKQLKEQQRDDSKGTTIRSSKNDQVTPKTA